MNLLFFATVALAHVIYVFLIGGFIPRLQLSTCARLRRWWPLGMVFHLVYIVLLVCASIWLLLNDHYSSTDKQFIFLLMALTSLLLMVVSSFLSHRQPLHCVESKLTGEMARGGALLSEIEDYLIDHDYHLLRRHEDLHGNLKLHYAKGKDWGEIIADSRGGSGVGSRLAKLFLSRIAHHSCIVEEKRQHGQTVLTMTFLTINIATGSNLERGWSWVRRESSKAARFLTSRGVAIDSTCEADEEGPLTCREPGEAEQ